MPNSPDPVPATRLDDFRMTEVSGVDHPAHQEEGWLVLKSKSLASGGTMPEPINKDALDPDIRAYIESLEGEVEVAKAAAAAAAQIPVPDPEPTDEATALAKALDATPEPIRKALEDATARAAAAEAVAKAEQDRRLDAEFQARAEALTSLSVNPAEFGPVLRKAAEALGEDAVAIFDVLKAANDTVAQAGLLNEVGSNVPSADTDAFGALESLAKARSAEKSVDFSVALSEVSAENPALYRQYLSESRKGA